MSGRRLRKLPGREERAWDTTTPTPASRRPTKKLRVQEAENEAEPASTRLQPCVSNTPAFGDGRNAHEKGLDRHAPPVAAVSSDLETLSTSPSIGIDDPNLFMSGANGSGANGSDTNGRAPGNETPNLYIRPESPQIIRPSPGAEVDRPLATTRERFAVWHRLVDDLAYARHTLPPRWEQMQDKLATLESDYERQSPDLEQANAALNAAEKKRKEADRFVKAYESIASMNDIRVEEAEDRLKSVQDFPYDSRCTMNSTVIADINPMIDSAKEDMTKAQTQRDDWNTKLAEAKRRASSFAEEIKSLAQAAHDLNKILGPIRIEIEQTRHDMRMFELKVKKEDPRDFE
ncbi:hypothetical protein FDECE_11535 [Fusarium decemcellulare]|nr:hypothetical protein FDECE_11535 [Fusarium decemcellulare]